MKLTFFNTYYCREENILSERIQIILKSGANVILTTGALDDMASKHLVEAGMSMTLYYIIFFSY